MLSSMKNIWCSKHKSIIYLNTWMGKSMEINNHHIMTPTGRSQPGSLHVGRVSDEAVYQIKAMLTQQESQSSWSGPPGLPGYWDPRGCRATGTPGLPGYWAPRGCRASTRTSLSVYQHHVIMFTWCLPHQHANMFTGFHVKLLHTCPSKVLFRSVQIHFIETSFTLVNI